MTRQWLVFFLFPELPANINGITRIDIINQYLNWKGKQYIPANVPLQIAWSSSNPMEEVENLNDVIENYRKQSKKPKTTSSVYQLVDKKMYVVAPGSVPLAHVTNKRKDRDDECDSPPPNKKRKLRLHSTQQGPVGLIWDEANFSCGYDSLISVLADIWTYHPAFWTSQWTEKNEFLGVLGKGLSKVCENLATLESIRDEIRGLLFARDHNDFPFGQMGVAIDKLTHAFFEDKTITSSDIYICSQCGENNSVGMLNCVISTGTARGTMNSVLKTIQTRRQGRCKTCHQAVNITRVFSQPPNLLAMVVAPDLVTVTKSVKVQCIDQSTSVHLRGVIYWVNENHFIARIITPDQTVWLNDGIIHGRDSVYEGELSDFSSKLLSSYNGEPACVYIYAK